MKNRISQFLNFSISMVGLSPIFYSLFPSFALAQLPTGTPITLLLLNAIILRISLFLIATSAVLAVIFIVWSGIMYMYAGEDTAKVTSAQNRLKSGIIGAAIIFGVGVIIQTIVSVVTLDFFCTARLAGVCIF